MLHLDGGGRQDAVAVSDKSGVGALLLQYWRTSWEDLVASTTHLPYSPASRALSARRPLTDSNTPPSFSAGGSEAVSNSCKCVEAREISALTVGALGS